MCFEREFLMRLATLLTGTLVAVLPVAAAASTLEMRVNDGEVIVADNGAGDSNGAAGILNAALGVVSGYEDVSINVVRQEAPPFDQLQADVDVFNESGGPASIKIEVTGHFANNAAGIWPGQFTATANDVRGSTWDIASYIGSAAYDTGATAQIGVTASGSLFAVSNLILFNANDYWITHVFNHTADRDNVSASANADVSVGPDSVTPVPVPAAGLLLMGGLGGLAAMRRRKG
jgi:hypothetical protein